MKIKNLYIALLILPTMALAQQVESIDLSNELSGELRAIDTGSSQLPAKANTTSSGDIYFQQNNSREELPATLVEASPLTESKAERLRRQREAAEMNTEMMIVEQLERDRIDAERKRAKALFGDKLQQNRDSQLIEQAPQQEALQEDEDLRADMEEIRSLVKEGKEAREEKAIIVEESPAVESSYAYQPDAYQQDSSFTMSVNAGVGNYPGVSNISGVYALGLSVGMEFDQGLMVEASYMNSEYDVDSISTGTRVELAENTISGALKYRILNTRVAPIVGVIASYTLRDYSDRGFGNYFVGGYNYGFNQGLGSASSQSLDLGLILGADVKVSQMFNVGLGMKYMFNISNRVDNDNNPFFNQSLNNNFYGLNYVNGTPIEELERLIIGVNATLKF